MENKELKIQIPAGYEIDKEKSTFEKIVFKKVEEKTLPKRWEDLKVVSGSYIDNLHGRIMDCVDFKANYETKHVFPTRAEAEACIALAQLCQLRDRYNDGWKPDWEDDDEQKYAIKISNNKTTVCVLTATSSVLSFKSFNLRDEFLENFRDLIETAKPLL